MISEHLTQKTLEYYDKHQRKDFVVSPSLPILYFGDVKKFSQSETKVVTVAKNPSHKEFRLQDNDDYSFVRFQKWRPAVGNLEETLNAYYKTMPYRSWFSSLEPLLNGLDASFYPKKFKNRAIHTDICSPLATNPTWSKLESLQKSDLYTEGIELWKLLIEELQPDIILVSIPHKLFESIFINPSKSIYTINDKKDGTERTKPYKISETIYKLKSGKQAKVYFGQAANKPFDTITKEVKIKIGEKIFELNHFD